MKPSGPGFSLLLSFWLLMPSSCWISLLNRFLVGFLFLGICSFYLGYSIFLVCYSLWYTLTSFICSKNLVVMNSFYFEFCNLNILFFLSQSSWRFFSFVELFQRTNLVLLIFDIFLFSASLISTAIFIIFYFASFSSFPLFHFVFSSLGIKLSCWFDVLFFYNHL